MNAVSGESIKLLQFLLPGILAAGFFQTLISSHKPSGVDVIIRAFVFTFFIQLLAQPIIDTYELDEFKSTFLLILIAVLFGGIAAFVWNKDILHGFFRKMKLTIQSPYYSTLYSAFTSNNDCYVVLHLKGDRRLYGWPTIWPSKPTDQFYLIEDYSWLSDTGSHSSDEDSQSHENSTSPQILIPQSEVEMVEFKPRYSKN